MAKTILIVGYGPGISTAVAEKFGSAGFSVALVGLGPGRGDHRRLDDRESVLGALSGPR
jgi:NAD(P)-dependent dehydrogenase (short-subunit alcohol dehydrogenase family)